MWFLGQVGFGLSLGFGGLVSGGLRVFENYQKLGSLAVGVSGRVEAL